MEHSLYCRYRSRSFVWEETSWLYPIYKESIWGDGPLLTRPGGIQPVLDVQDLFIFGSGKCFLTDLIILGDFLLKEWVDSHS